ncbi:MAG: hypothetical protein HUN04_12175 [Desulfobacter sp.]|nr:MAG: hypothetical protein HUN04_12175 [Desulfobacter sp.]
MQSRLPSRFGRSRFAAALLFLACFCLPTPGTASGAPGLVITPDIQYGYALDLFKKGDYTAAQVELKRFIHFFPGDARVAEAEFKTAMALYHSGQFHEAARRFNDIILKEKESPYTRESYFMQSKAFQAMDNPGYAGIVLQNYLKLTEDPETRDRIYLELARLHIRETRELGKNQLEEAQKYLTLISPDRKGEYNVPARLAALEKVKAAPQKNPAAAGILALIPGGGFLYCERYKDAFVTFCLNAGLIWGAYEAFDSGNPALGGVVSFVESGFYAGNIYGSITAAHKYNKTQQIKILDRHFNLTAGIDPGNGAYLITFNHEF